MRPHKEKTLGERLRELRGASREEIGWVCPKCGNVYAPRALACSRCNKPPLDIIR